MGNKTFGLNEIIFRQGDESPCMYAVRKGSAGVFLDYGGPDETKLAELLPGQFLGEMGMLDSTFRSATAVSLAEETELEVITEADFSSYLEANPEKILLLMQQMCARLRRSTRDYAGVCCTVRDVLEAEEAGLEKSEELQERIETYTAQFSVPDTDADHRPKEDCP